MSKEELFADLDEVVLQVDKMAKIVDHMRTYTRTSDGSLNETLDINEIITNALKFGEQQIKNHGISLVIKLSSDLPSLYGDSIRLEQVVINIITNARHAVENSPKENKCIKIKTSLSTSEKNELIVDIKDNGEGIPKDVEEKIFNPFFTTKEKGKGTGLGLSITKTIVEEHRGKIKVESEIGVGTSFKVILPVYRTI